MGAGCQFIATVELEQQNVWMLDVKDLKQRQSTLQA